MSYVIHEVAQGSAEWHQARAGCVTASMFKVARSKVNCLDERQQKYVNAILNGSSEAMARADAGYKAAPTSDTVARALRGERVGEPSDTAKAYAFRLAIERIAGAALQDDKFETYAMRRGHELEPLARAEHEKLGILVQRAGFVTTPDGKRGASVDGLIDPYADRFGHRGNAEYKCLVSPDELRAVLLEDDLSSFTDQMQGGMMVTHAQYFHFGLYCPALEPIGQQFTLKVIDRDEAYITALRRDLDEFELLVQDYEDRLRHGAEVNAQSLALLMAAEPA